MITGLLNGLLDRTIVLSFDKLGFLRHSLSFEPADLEVDLQGRVCLITGGNAGLGLAAARGLARLGAEVWLLCRHQGRGDQAAGAIRRETGNDQVFVRTIDVSDLADIRRFCARFPRPRVDVLINNAGVLLDRYEPTRDGLERTLATNLVGPFLLTMRLLARLRKSDDGRVIMVSSGGMYTQRLAVSDLEAPPEPFDGVKTYARTKRAEVVLAELWHDTLADTGVTFSSMHPGWADTPGVRTSLPRFWAVTRLILRTPDEGADTIVWLGAAARVKGQGGRFWFDRAPVSTHVTTATRESPEERDALWDALVRWSGLTREMLRVKT